MASITLPSGIRIAVEYSIHDKVVVNIYHVTTTDPIVTIKLIALAQLFADWYASDLSFYSSFSLYNIGVTAHDISVVNGEKYELVISPPYPGAVGLPSVPNNVAVVASLITSKTGRSFQGRTYLPGIPESEVLGNTVLVAQTTAYVNAFIALQAQLTLAASELVVASFISGGVPRAVGVATPVTSVAVKNRVDTQRRRLPRE